MHIDMTLYMYTHLSIKSDAEALKLCTRTCTSTMEFCLIRTYVHTYTCLSYTTLNVIRYQVWHGIKCGTASETPLIYKLSWSTSTNSVTEWKRHNQRLPKQDKNKYYDWLYCLIIYTVWSRVPVRTVLHCCLQQRYSVRDIPTCIYRGN